MKCTLLDTKGVRMNDDDPSLTSTIFRSAERIRQLDLTCQAKARLDRLELAARLLGGNRRKGQRLPVRKQAMIKLDGQSHCSATIDIGEHGFMLDRPARITDPAEAPASVTIEQLGMLETELVGWTRKTLSFRLVKQQEGTTAARQAVLIGSLQRQAVKDISRACQFAAEISFAFVRAVNQRQISLAQLYSSSLRPITGTDPAQYEHPAQHWFDANMPDIMSRHVQPDANMAYAVATDRNGYLPVHQPAYAQPQRPHDILFNQSFSRHRRIYDDRWTLNAARFSAKPIIQARQRDMPEGLGALVRNVSAPIRVMDHHWGAAQIGTIMDGPT